MGPYPYITYSNQGATRNLPLSDRLASTLSYLQDMGLTANVFSGGQEATGPRRTGSHRHDEGNAADVTFYKDGRPISWENPADLPTFEEIVRRGKAAGITGFGAGEGYMRPGTMHVGFGAPGVWGAGGAGSSAPGWLVNAYAGGGPQMATDTAPAQPSPSGAGSVAMASNGASFLPRSAVAPDMSQPTQPPQADLISMMFGGQNPRQNEWLHNTSYSHDALMSDFLAGQNPLKRYAYQTFAGMFG